MRNEVVAPSQADTPTPFAAPTATLIHHIPGWALFTAILLADQIIPVLRDHGKQERREKL